jgi:hypothetical protein
MLGSTSPRLSSRHATRKSGSGGSARGSTMGSAAAQEGAKAGAGCGFPVWFPRLLPLSTGVLTWAIAQERHPHFYMPLAVDRSLPVDVRYLRLSSRGLCLADHVLSQLSPSRQSGASIPVCYLFCHVFAIANCRFSQTADALHWLCRPGRACCAAVHDVPRFAVGDGPRR